MNTRLTGTQRVEALTPALVSGLRWLFDVEQPATALVRAEGIALPPLLGRRLIFVPGSDRDAAAVIMQTVATPPTAELLGDEEISALAAAAEHLTGAAVAVQRTTEASHAVRIQLSRLAHRSLRAALARFRAGCPVHHQPACGHTRGPEAPCQWYARGAKALIGPPEPVILPVLAPPHPVTAASIAALGTANARRRDRGARRAVAAASDAIALLTRSPRGARVPEEALRVLRLRVEHPDLSLRELAELHDPPMTKDSYAARLRRALQLVDRPTAGSAGKRPHDHAA